jgi:predicted RNA-binding protein with PUA-like domain
MSKQYWLVKQEPADYPWSQLVQDQRVAWTGVRNFQARNNLRGMREGDTVAYYHSGEGKEVVGVARVARVAYPDPTATEGDWSAVDLVPVKALTRSVTLKTFKSDAILRESLLARHSRLSVMPLTPEQFARVLELGGTVLKQD